MTPLQSISKNGLLLLSLVVGSISMTTNTAYAQRFLIGGFGDGIYASELRPDGSMKEPTLAVKQTRPAFFTIHPNMQILYSVTESARTDATAPAAVNAYRVELQNDQTVLVLINSQPIDADGPCHICVDGKGRLLAVANYSSGSAMLFPLNTDGSIVASTSKAQYQGSGPNRSRQESPHAHCCAWDPTNRFLLVADLGTDQVMVHEVDSDQGLLKSSKSSLQLAPGAGPRHIAFHPNGRNVFVINELNTTLTSAKWDAAKGVLSEVQTLSTLPAGTTGNEYSTAEVLVHPSGRFVYGSNRGHHTIVGFAIDEANGNLRYISHTSTGGKTPRNFRISPDGAFLLAENQDSNSIHSFKIDLQSGELKATGHSIQSPMPACIKFLK